MPDLSGRRDNVQPRPSEKDHEHLAALGRCLAITFGTRHRSSSKDALSCAITPVLHQVHRLGLEPTMTSNTHVNSYLVHERLTLAISSLISGG